MTDPSQDDRYDLADTDDVSDQSFGYGMFVCPNCGSSMFHKKIEDGVYIELCTQNCEYALYVPLYVAPDGSIGANFDEAEERGLNDGSDGRLPEG